jgi:hypothetical protein
VKRAIATAALVALCAAAHAKFWDGNLLHNYLNGSQGEQVLALGFIIGVADSLHGEVQCAPANATAGQMRDMVAGFLNRVPNSRHLPAEALVAFVLINAWPCQKKNKGAGV